MISGAVWVEKTKTIFKTVLKRFLSISAHFYFEVCGKTLSKAALLVLMYASGTYENEIMSQKLLHFFAISSRLGPGAPLS